MKTSSILSYGHIFRFWLPLAATWLMMSLEGPFLTALIARLANPEYNLAAYGVAFAFALLMESPVIMMMSAATKLVTDRAAYQRLRKFNAILGGAVTAAMLIFVIPAVFYRITLVWMELPETVARLTHTACLVLLPWPAAIGYRRFYQGILIRQGKTRVVALGTLIRLISMALIAIFCFGYTDLEGVVIGAAALTGAVLTEALATRLMSGSAITGLPATTPGSAQPAALTYTEIAKFYFPLALTPLIALAGQPILNAFMAKGVAPIESLAVLPVINALIFLFRSPGLAYVETSITLLGDRNENYAPLRNFAILLGITVSIIVLVIATTPLSAFWFEGVSGLSESLAQFAVPPTLIMAFLPALSILMSFQRSLLINARNTTPISWATALELSMIIGILWLSTYHFEMIGAVGAALALLIGRLAANLYLFPPFFKVLRK